SKSKYAAPMRAAKALLLLLAMLVAMATTLARPHHWTPDTYPNPHKTPGACQRQNQTGWVCDPDKVLSFESANAVDALLRRVATGAKPFTQAACGSSGLEGFPLAVALMHRMYTTPD
ncbi:hypothetical protein Agub_g9669, partial [Astrephomene gubernaculifera]